MNAVEKDGEIGELVDEKFSFYDSRGKRNLLTADTKSKDIKIFGYYKSKKGWIDIGVGTENPKISKLDEFVVATQNVWFGSFKKEIRYQEILKSIGDSKPAIVCLQEVTSDFLYEFVDHPEMMKHYLISDNPMGMKETFYRYGAALLIRKDLEKSIVSAKQFFLPSGMARSLIHVELRLGGIGKAKGKDIRINVGSIHLESLRSPVYRRSQLRLISDRVQKEYDNCLLCGDFNFGALSNYYPEVKPLENDFFKSSVSGDLKNYQDTWCVTNSSPGYTKDWTNNKMFANECPEKKDHGHFRYDRIMLKSKELEVRECKLWNNEQIDEELDVFPSDHFGVKVVLDFL